MRSRSLVCYTKSLNYRLVLSQIDELLFWEIVESLDDGFSPQIIIVQLARSIAAGDRWLPSSRVFPAYNVGGKVTTALQGFLERHSEFSVKVGVDERIERWVEVTNPEDEGDHPRGAVAESVAAKSRYDVPVNKYSYYFGFFNKWSVISLEWNQICDKKIYRKNANNMAHRIPITIIQGVPLVPNCSIF